MNKDLEKLVQSRTSELKESNKELSKTIKDLEKAQESLIHSEKMASLGQLIAGVSHELMTPIGILLTIADHIKIKLEELEQKVKDNRLSFDDMNKFMRDQKEAVELVDENARRTQDFVLSLKRTSVDQMSMEQRTFNICETIEDTLRSTKIRFKRSHVKSESSMFKRDSYVQLSWRCISNNLEPS